MRGWHALKGELAGPLLIADPLRKFEMKGQRSLQLEYHLLGFGFDGVPEGRAHSCVMLRDLCSWSAHALLGSPFPGNKSFQINLLGDRDKHEARKRIRCHGRANLKSQT